MKHPLLLILFILSVHFAFSQNVKIIRASERTTVNNNVIIPAPVPPANSNVSAGSNRKAGKKPAVKPTSKKNGSIKGVHGVTEKKPCVKKVCCDQKNPAPASMVKPSESAGK